MGKRIQQAVVAIALAVLLTACGSVAPPTAQLVQQAVALELSQTQRELSQQLRLGIPTKVQINHLTIAEQTPLTIDHLNAFRVRGTYDYTVQYPSRQVKQRNNPFEVYLQRQREGKTWRLAKLVTDDETGQPTWVTQRITF